MPRLKPPPVVAPDTWHALLDVAADYAALAPWKFASDTEIVGLTDARTGEVRIGQALGNAGEVFAAVFYRRDGLRWILSMLSEQPDPENLDNAEGMDLLKVEFVPKRELWKEDLAMLKTAGFVPPKRGRGWPQFRSCDPGWHPWHLNQSEAAQFLADLPQLTAFFRMLADYPDLYEKREALEIPFLPGPLPERPLQPRDLDWRPLLPLPPAGLDPFQASSERLEALRSLDRRPGLDCEFDCSLMPGGSFVENGRPCFGRLGLLVEKENGLVLGMDMQGGAVTPGEAAGQSLIEALLMAGRLSGRIFIAGSRLQPVLEPLCDELQVELWPVSSLPALDSALDFLGERLMREEGLGGF